MKAIDNIIDGALALLIIILLLLIFTSDTKANVLPAKKYTVGSGVDGRKVLCIDDYQCRTYISTDTTLVEGHVEKMCR